jgi:hypothetical protein
MQSKAVLERYPNYQYGPVCESAVGRGGGGGVLVGLEK